MTKSTSTDPPSKAPPAPSLFWRLMHLSWRYRWGVAVLLLLQALITASTLAGLALVGWGIDLARGRFDMARDPLATAFLGAKAAELSPQTALLVVGGGMLLNGLLRVVLTYVQSAAAGVLVHRRIIVDLRNEVYAQLQRLSFRFYDQAETGSVINRVTSDVAALRQFIDGVLLQIVQVAFCLAFYVVYMLSLHVQLTCVCLATTPLLWAMSVMFSRKVRPAYDLQREVADRMILRLTENVQGVQVVKGFGQEQAEEVRFEKASADVVAQQARISGWISAHTPAVSFLTQLNLALLLLYGGWLVIHDQLPLGAGLVVFAGLLQQFSAQVTNVAGIANSIQQSLAGARRVFEILDHPRDVESPLLPVPLGKVRGEVEFDHVTFGYGDAEPILHDVSLKIRPGECIAIVGATGAGKTSLLALLPRFYDPQAGRVLLDGRDLRSLDLDELRRSIGVVFQETFLFSNTVWANIAFGMPDATDEQVRRAAVLASAHEFIAELPKGYDSVLGESGVDLSGGQRQRIALARALLLDPPILLLDGPTSAVDPETEQLILEAMDQACASRTTFIVAHRLSTLRRADRIVVLDRGRIVQMGTHVELVAAPGPYRKMALAQIGVDERSLRRIPLESPQASTDEPAPR